MKNLLDYYDQIMDQFEPVTQSNFPPYDTYVYADKGASVVVALAGYTRDDIDVTFDGSLLYIRGKRREESEEDANACVHRGIARRSFELRFKVPDNLVVSSAELLEGLLTVRFVIDEAKAPKQIPIM